MRSPPVPHKPIEPITISAKAIKIAIRLFFSTTGL
jgi:hypothetical protein